MVVSASPVVDLCFSLICASDRYRDFIRPGLDRGYADLFAEIANERVNDANRLLAAAHEVGIPDAESNLNCEAVRQLLGLGRGLPRLGESALRRVRRSENTLRQMVAQLRSLFGSGPMKTVLGAIGENITKRLDSLGVTLRQSITISHSAAGDPVCYGDEGHLVDVWFGTNRVRNSSGSYIAERAATTMYGRCRVFVPCNRPLGSLGSAFFDRLVFGDNRVKVRLISQLDCQKFWKALSGVTLSTEEEHRHGVIFVHGYNTTFKDAARRAAQLKVDLAHRGPVAFFSWPSLNFALGYICDGAAIEASELALRQFLIDFVERSGVSSVHVIAHSMGNRALIRALDAIANNVSLSSSIRFGQIIIAAPDVDAQVFQNLGEAYTKLSKRATLYVTANDTAIGWSRRLHGFPRAGLTPPVTIVPGVDTVDASDINIGLLGHSYAVELRPLLGDIHRLVQKDTPPDERFGLRRASDAFPIYWEFQR